MRRPLPWISIALLSALLLGAVAVPWISQYDYFTPEWDALDLAPGEVASHPLGTDALGRDLLVRLAWSCRISLLVAFAASLISMVIGITWGSTAGYLGGRVDALMMRIVDILYSIPFTPFVIVLTVLFGRNLLLLFVAIGAVSWLDVARIVRGQARSLREREFVTAAQIAGVRTSRILARHIVPNMFGIVMAYLTLTIPTLILTEAFLSYLGLGAQAPLTSLGTMLADGAAQMRSRPELLMMPAVVLILIVYCCNRIGDSLRDRHAG